MGCQCSHVWLNTVQNVTYINVDAREIQAFIYLNDFLPLDYMLILSSPGDGNSYTLIMLQQPHGVPGSREDQKGTGCHAHDGSHQHGRSTDHHRPVQPGGGCVCVVALSLPVQRRTLNTINLPLCRLYRRSPSLTRHGTRPCTSWLSSGTSRLCRSPASPPGPTTCRPCTCLLPCCSPPSAGSISAPLQRRRRAPETCTDSETIDSESLFAHTGGPNLKHLFTLCPLYYGRHRTMDMFRLWRASGSRPGSFGFNIDLESILQPDKLFTHGVVWLYSPA